jgi:hypothetical protein
MATRTQRIMAATITPVLLTGGIALAATNSDNGSSSKQKSQSQQGNRGPRGGGPGDHHGGPGRGFDRNLTYAELHLWRSGKEVVVRIDKGKVSSTSADSITITEANSEDVTIKVDANTKVESGPPWAKQTTKVTDLKAGTQVIVEHEGDSAAKEIHVAPKAGQRPPMPSQGQQGNQQQGYAPSGAPSGQPY